MSSMGEKAGRHKDGDNTSRSFADKWGHNPRLAFDATLREDSEIARWILRRNGLADFAALERLLNARVRVLDAGCGNGRVTALLREHSEPDETEIIGIDLTAAHIASRNLSGYRNVTVLERDLLDDLSELGRFDFIYCQEVLHHTVDPKRAFLNLSLLLDRGGEIAIYVYREKAPVREFTDDFVRGRIADLEYEGARVACAQITQLGRALAEQHVTVTIPDVDVLGIKAGTYDIQRLLYHYFAKCFWNSELSFDENVAINYDWYHPETASRHTEAEVRAWFDEAGLEMTHVYVDEYGITMWGRAPA